MLLNNGSAVFAGMEGMWKRTSKLVLKREYTKTAGSYTQLSSKVTDELRTAFYFSSIFVIQISLAHLFDLSFTF